jgi:hypothetical protein
MKRNAAKRPAPKKRIAAHRQAPSTTKRKSATRKISAADRRMNKAMEHFIRTVGPRLRWDAIL